MYICIYIYIHIFLSHIIEQYSIYDRLSGQWMIMSVVFFQYHRLSLLLNFPGQDAIDVRQLKTKLA